MGKSCWDKPQIKIHFAKSWWKLLLALVQKLLFFPSIHFYFPLFKLSRVEKKSTRSAKQWSLRFEWQFVAKEKLHSCFNCAIVGFSWTLKKSLPIIELQQDKDSFDLWQEHNYWSNIFTKIILPRLILPSPNWNMMKWISMNELPQMNSKTFNDFYLISTSMDFPNSELFPHENLSSATTKLFSYPNLPFQKSKPDSATGCSAVNLIEAFDSRIV